MRFLLSSVCLILSLGVVRGVESNPAEALVVGAYQQKDIDTLTLVARRHLGRALTKTEETKLRAALPSLLMARAGFIEALDELPKIFTGAQRDRIILDLLDYTVKATPTDKSDRSQPASNSTAGDDQRQLLALPPIAAQRQIKNQTYGISIAVTLLGARELKPQTPLIQDAILSHLHDLADEQFKIIGLADIKSGLSQALATFPIRRVLITDFKRE